MKILLALTAMVMSLFVITSAQADVYHSHYRHSYHAKQYTTAHRHYSKNVRRHSIHRTNGIRRHEGYERVYLHMGGYHRGVGGRPRAWCGWFMRTIFGGGPEYNVAANWRYRGRPSGPHTGAIVVWPHHVGLIVGKTGSRWIVKSGNWNNRVAVVPMSLRGAIAFRTP